MASTGFFRPSIIQQNFPGKPKFTGKDLPDLAGRVYLVTGANTGVGKELAQILYAANGTVYLACRTESKAQAALQAIAAAAPTSTGRLAVLLLDLADLASIRPAVAAFSKREDRLDVLFNNAGVMYPPDGATTAQGYDMQLGTNCLGPLLLAELLTPALARTAATQPAGAVRVVWVASMAAELYSVRHGIDMARLIDQHYADGVDTMTLYGNSKAGNYLHSCEYARRHQADGIVSVAANPGNLDTDLYLNADAHGFFLRMIMYLFTKSMLYPRIYGAYTELFAGLSPAVTMEKTGSWIGPWGRFFRMRSDIAQGVKAPSEGGLGVAAKFWDWSMEQVKPFV